MHTRQRTIGIAIMSQFRRSSQFSQNSLFTQDFTDPTDPTVHQREKQIQSRVVDTHVDSKTFEDWAAHIDRIVSDIEDQDMRTSNRNFICNDLLDLRTEIINYAEHLSNSMGTNSGLR
jgi:hypothetical protein